LKHLQSFIAVFNEQVLNGQNFERSKESIGEDRSCLDAVKSTIKERKKHMFISTHIKSKLNELKEEGQDHARQACQDHACQDHARSSGMLLCCINLA